MAWVRYEAILVRRSTNQFTEPTLNTIDEIIVKERLSWSSELRGDGGFCTFALDPDTQSQDVKDILVNIEENACEIWLYRNGTLVFAGPVIGVQTQGLTVIVIARQIGYYLRYMVVQQDMDYTNTEQYTIVKDLINQWQALDYAHFGIDTSTIGSSGVTRTIQYRASEAPQVLKSIQQLGDNVDGFEFYVDINTRDAVCTGRRGSDKSADVIIDGRNIESPNVYFSVAQGDYANHVIAIGGNVEAKADPVVGTKVGTVTQLQRMGRVAYVLGVDGATQVATVEDYAQSALDLLGVVNFQPSTGTVVPALGADVMDFDAGDTITWVYDHGLGTSTFVRDVYKKTVSVSAEGRENMTVEFL